MLCEKCHAKQANVHIVKIVNGEKTEQRLCETCAAKTHDFLGPAEINLKKLFPYFMGQASAPAPQVAKCPYCNWSLPELHRTGKLGCSNCYAHFRQYMNPILQRIHTSSVHNGKRPKSSLGSQVASSVVADSAARRKAAQLAELKMRLTRCIREENFEEAAVLRDQIHQAESAEEDRGLGGGVVNE